MNHPEKIGIESLPALLLPWYAENRRDLPWRADREPYHVWLSEIMLQQTRVEAVIPYYMRFLQSCPDIFALAKASEEQLFKLWEGLGYYRRARLLHQCAKTVVADYGGHFPHEEASLRALPGIGPYTAGAIASICFGAPTPAVDGNVLRVITRMTGDTAPIELNDTKARITAQLSAIYPTSQCGNFTQALMELGATVCLPRGEPRCAECPASAICRAHMENAYQTIPAHLEKRARKIEEKTVFLLRCAGKIAIRRRPHDGLLGGLWELPNLPGTMPIQQALTQAEAWKCMPSAPIRTIEAHHIFTHIEWNMRGHEIACLSESPLFVWCTEEELTQTYALPTAFRQFLHKEI